MHPKIADAPSCREIHARAARLSQTPSDDHRQFRQGLRHYLVNSRFMALLAAPLIWLCLIPILLMDLVGTFYQAVCFPIYGIPKVNRRDYVTLDRHRLAYLNLIEKLNCDYCSYVNGILAYFTEIAARTEQHWCPIKHEGCVKCAHSRYKKFVAFGDAKEYRQQVEKIRWAFQDIDPTASPRGEHRDGG